MAPASAGNTSLRVMLYIVSMGFAVWIDGEVAWAQGTHEYRPMGAAVVSTEDLFSHRDFSIQRKTPDREERTFVGLFASLSDVNAWLYERRGSITKRTHRRKTPAFLE